ncbi:MAG: phosphate transporter permease subunit PstC, partial [Bacteroidetes bacterium]|nr:phosphate transporter permease subunit PstC [Bacteroidota bacterium]
MNQDESTKKKPEFQYRSSLSRSVGKKQFRFSDWFAEKLIKTVSFFSIAFVILIFLFVFRETLPMFNGTNNPEKKERTGIRSENANELKPESYSAGEEDQTGEELRPEGYSPDEEDKDREVLRPEVYSPDEEVHDPDEVRSQAYSPDQETGDAGELRPEIYGDVVPETVSSDSIGDETEAADDAYTIGEEAEDPVKTLFSKDWQPVSDKPRYGLLPLFIGTLKVTLMAILFAAPLAILAALYTAMFATPRWKEIIKPVIELLAGFPSV